MSGNTISSPPLNASEHTSNPDPEEPEVNFEDLVGTELGIEDVMKDPEKWSEYLSEFDVDDWDAFIGIVHMNVAPNVDSEHTGRHMGVSGRDGVKKYLMAPEDRRQFMENVVGLLGDMKDSLAVAEDNYAEYLKRVANMIAMSVVLSHSYEDGNGRTARVMALLIRGGDSSGQEYIDDIKLLGANRPQKGFRVNSFLRKVKVEPGNKDKPKYSIGETMQRLASVGVPLNDIEAYLRIVEDTVYSPFDD